MTDKPADEALENLFVEETGFDPDDFPAAILDFARAVLAKWGQPAQKTVTVVPATGDVWLKHDDDLRYVRRVLEAGRQMTDVDQRAAIDIVQGLRVTARAMAVDAKKPAQAAEPVAREPLPKFLALKFHARRDKKATVTLLFPGHEAADAWVRGIKGGQHGAE